MKIQLYKDKLEGIVDESDFEIINNSLNSDLEYFNDEKSRMMGIFKNNVPTIDLIIKEGLNIQKKEVIGRLISKITIDDHKMVRIFYKFRSNFE